MSDSSVHINRHGYSATDAAEYDKVIASRYSTRIGRALLDKFTEEPNETVLDLSCHTGSVTLDILHRLGPKGRIVALESDPELLNVARHKARHELGKRVFFAAATSCDQWRFEDDVFSTVVGNLPFEDMADPKATMHAVRRVLAPAGRILLTRMLQGSFQEMLDMFHEVAMATNEQRVLQRISTIRDRYLSENAFVEFAQSVGFERVTLQSAEFALRFANATDLQADPLLQRIVLGEWQWISEAGSDPRRFLEQAQHAMETYFSGQSIPLTIRYGLLEGYLPDEPARHD